MRSRTALTSLILASALQAAAQTPPDLIKQGDALDRLHRHREVLALYQRAAEAEADNAEILRRLAKQYSDLMEESRGSTDKTELAAQALACALEAKKLAPRNAKVRLTAAIVYGKTALLQSPRRQIEMAQLIKEELDASLALDPKDSLAWYVLGRWNYELANLNPLLKGIAEAVFGKFPDAGNEAAAKCFEKAAALDPAGVACRIELGRTLAAMGKKAEAREWIEKGLASSPGEKEDDGAVARGRETLLRL